MNVSDLTPDPFNANAGTERGRGMLEKSIERTGFGRGILIDRNDKIIAGNKAVQVAGEMGITTVRVIETHGREIIAVKRMDLDLDDPETRARELAIFDNRVAEVDLAWNADLLAEYAEAGIELDHAFHPAELEELLGLSAVAMGFDGVTANEGSSTGPSRIHVNLDGELLSKLEELAAHWGSIDLEAAAQRSIVESHKAI